MENLGADGRILGRSLNLYGVRCVIDSSESAMGQVTRPIELLDYPQNYVRIISSKIILRDVHISSVSKKVSSKSYIPD